MDFEYPFLLFLLIPVFLFWLWAWRKREPSIRVSSVENIKQIRRQDLHIRFNFRKDLPMWCFFLAGLCIVVALAGPRQGAEQIISRADGIDII